MWYCGDKSKHSPHLKMLRSFDVQGIRRGGKKVSIMKCLMCHIERSYDIVNIT